MMVFLPTFTQEINIINKQQQVTLDSAKGQDAYGKSVKQTYSPKWFFGMMVMFIPWDRIHNTSPPGLLNTCKLLNVWIPPRSLTQIDQIGLSPFPGCQ